MKRCYIIEFGGEKEVNEMKALEIGFDDINDAFDYIIETMDSDGEYFNCNIECTIYLLDIALLYSSHNHYCKALVYVDADDEIGIQVREDECSDIETIIETNLSIISKITHKMMEVV